MEKKIWIKSSRPGKEDYEMPAQVLAHGLFCLSTGSVDGKESICPICSLSVGGVPEIENAINEHLEELLPMAIEEFQKMRDIVLTEEQQKILTATMYFSWTVLWPHLKRELFIPRILI